MHHLPVSLFSAGKWEHTNLNLEHADAQKDNELLKYP